MVSLPNTIWACAAGAMNSAPTATATAFLFIFPPPRRRSLMRNIDLEHGTTLRKLQATLHGVKSMQGFLGRSSWRSAANLRKRDHTVRTDRACAGRA